MWRSPTPAAGVTRRERPRHGPRAAVGGVHPGSAARVPGAARGVPSDPGCPSAPRAGAAAPAAVRLSVPPSRRPRGGVTPVNDTTLADLRRLSGLSQREVARRMGVSRGRPGQIERDFPRVRFEVVQAYIRALGGRIEFAAIGGCDVWADEITQHPDGHRDHGDRTGVRTENHQPC
ncbi:helix-turn-helix domain-containing protein [Streptomyces massasporeus]